MLKRLLLLSLLVFGIALFVRGQKAEREIYIALHIGDEIFEENTWLASAQEYTDRTTAIWRADDLSAVAQAEYLHFDDGFSSDQLETYFDARWFEDVFVNYVGFRELNTCQGDGLDLHEFSMLFDGAKYTARYWIRPLSETRVLTLFLLFPTQERTSLDDYAGRLFPDLITCDLS